MILSRCSHTKDIIEPFLKSQWYIESKHMAYYSIQVVQSKENEMISPISNHSKNIIESVLILQRIVDYIQIC